MRILIAEDEQTLSEAICQNLIMHHYTVDAVCDGEEALAYAASEHYDGILLDITMPKMDGLSVLRRLREMGNQTPIMLVTARTEVESRIEGLNAGADDYLCKPFSMGELLARVRAMLRRRETYVPDCLHFGDLVLDQGNLILSCGENAMKLSRLEFKMMELMMRHPHIALSGDMLLEHIWGYDAHAQMDTVWVYISCLRKKLKTLHAGVEIRTRRGVGYALELKNE